jgi:hypothetical protein
MQSDYQPDGWLGIILGSKIFVNFKKYPFEECMRRLMVELRPISEQPIKNEVFPTTTNIIKPEQIDLKNWSVDDVQSWCSKYKFNSDIRKMVREFNGELLIQLNEIKKQSSDYFYTSISHNNKIDLISVVYFTNEFQKLFK